MKTVNRVRGFLTSILCAVTFAGPAREKADEPKLNDAQQIALYQYVLANSKDFCRPFRSILLLNEVSNEVFAKLRAIDPRCSRTSDLDAKTVSTYLAPEVVENRRLHVFATVGPADGPNRGFSVFLRKRKSSWLVEKAHEYPMPPEMLAAAFEAVLAETARGAVYVDAPAAVMKLLRMRHPSLRPASELKPKTAKVDDPDWVEVDASSDVVWQSRRLARFYLHTMSHQKGWDVAGELAGPVRVWRSAHGWKAKKVEYWGGE